MLPKNSSGLRTSENADAPAGIKAQKTRGQRNLTKGRITVCISDVNMHCLTYCSRHAYITIHLCRFVSRPISFAGLPIQAFQQMRLTDVCVSHCNDGHIFNGGGGGI